MNDFTKTDLNEIHRCLKYMTNCDITPYSCHTIALAKRIREMIDNYCEHEPEGDFHICVDKCKKCGEFY